MYCSTGPDTINTYRELRHLSMFNSGDSCGQSEYMGNQTSEGKMFFIYHFDLCSQTQQVYFYSEILSRINKRSERTGKCRAGQK